MGLASEVKKQNTLCVDEAIDGWSNLFRAISSSLIGLYLSFVLTQKGDKKSRLLINFGRLAASFLARSPNSFWVQNSNKGCLLLPTCKTDWQR